VKRIRWYRTTPYFDAIAWYKEHLYEEWWGSLTPEEQREYEENKEQRLNNILRCYARINAILAGSHFM
jgi:hypothetical protein